MAEKNKNPEVRFAGFTDDWEQHEMGELLGIRSASRVHKNEWTKSGVPFFRSSDVVADYKGIENNKVFISFELYEKLSNESGRVHKNDLLVTGGGSIGIPYLVKSNEPLYFKDADLLWLKNANNINSYFLYTFFSTLTFRHYVNSITHIGTISHYTIEQAKSTPIKVPRKEEQDKIGEYLANIDKFITLHQRKYVKLVTIKKAMLEKMFPKNGADVPEIRFKGFTEAWEEQKLSEICEDTYGGGTPSTSVAEYWNGNIVWIQSSDLVEDQLSNVIPKKRITEKGLRASATKLIPKNSIAIVTRVGVGKLSLMLNEYATSQDFLSLGRLKIDNWFSVYSIWKKLNSELHAVQGTSIKGITKEELLSKRIMVPVISQEQSKIGDLFREMDYLINLHQQELEKLKNIKKACFEKMFV